METRVGHTADGVRLVEGLRVWDNNLCRVVVGLRGAFEDNGELWFDTYRLDGSMAHLMSESRVSTRHPGTGEEA